MTHDTVPAVRRHLFADESGDFDFSPKHQASRFFTLCTVSIHDCAIGNRLLELRRELAWGKAPLGEYFHATEDKQAIRDQVFALLAKEDFRIDATVLEKNKAQPKIRTEESVFYKYGWFYHLKYIAPHIMRGAQELMITAASLGTGKKKAAFKGTVNDVAQQIGGGSFSWNTYFCPCSSDPCLQVADYCTWAIHKKWERGDHRSYDLIRNKVRSEFDLFKAGSTRYY